MSAPSDILRLFTELALAISGANASAGTDGNDEDDSGAGAAASLPSLVASLKPDPDASSGSRVLDAALSLMCFRSPVVYGSTIDGMVKTMISVLSSSVSCKVDRLQGGSEKDGGILRVGSSIFSADREKLLGMCVDVVECLGGHVLCQSLVGAALKAAVSASDCQSLFPMSCLYYERSDLAREGRSSVILKLQSLLPVEISVNDHEIPLRLLLWYLDPLLLKDAISNILRETIHRPFLCLKNEFHERMAWRILIICLVTSPTLFTQTRALLHKWFLVTGLASVLELQIAIVSSLLDVLSRPMWWGLSVEWGLKLPFSHAYFPPCDSELLAALTGPISCQSFLSLVNLIGVPLAPTGDNINLTTSHLSPDSFHWNAAEVTRINYTSTWAMLMNFPAWFYFATVLIFFGENFQRIFLTNSRPRAVEAESKTANVMELQHAASRYLAFVLSPLDEDDFNLCFNLVTEMPLSWTMKMISESTGQCLNLETGVKNAFGHKKLRKHKAPDTQKFHNVLDGHESEGIEIWLGEFHKYYEKFRIVTGHSLSELRTMEIVNERSSLLFTRISLGMLICCISYLDERECTLLLNYAATGEILHMEDTQIMKSEKPRKKNLVGSTHKFPSMLSSISGSEWAFRGTALVFNLFDCIEEISSSFCDSEDEMLDFICLMKGKTGSYLLTCIREIILSYVQLDDDEGSGVMLKDLSMRLIRWRQQGREAFEGCAAFDDILDDLNRR